MMSTLTAHCQWEDETVRERTCHPPSYAGAKKMKSITLHTHGCLRASLPDRSSSSYLWLISAPTVLIATSAIMSASIVALSSTQLCVLGTDAHFWWKIKCQVR